MDSIPPIKRHRLTDWIHKQDSKFCCILKTHLSNKERQDLRIKGWKTIFQANGFKEQSGVAIKYQIKSTFNLQLSKKIRKDTSYSSKEKYTKRYSQFQISMLQISGYPHS
jgi:exonuclease III